MKTFIYSDESGIDGCNRFFLIGMLIVNNRNQLTEFIKDVRERYSCNKELHWNNMSNSLFRCYSEVLSNVWYQDIKYCCICVDKYELDIDSHFGGKDFKAYNYFTRLLFCNRLKENMQAICYIDYKNREKLDNGLDYLIRQTNKIQPNCLKKIEPMVSEIDDCMQVCDVITGAIRYKIEFGTSSSKRGYLASLLDNQSARLKRNGKLDIWIWKPRKS